MYQCQLQMMTLNFNVNFKIKGKKEKERKEKKKEKEGGEERKGRKQTVLKKIKNIYLILPLHGVVSRGEVHLASVEVDLADT